MLSIEVCSLREDAKEKRTARGLRVDVRAAYCCVAINAIGCSLIERRALSTAVCRGCFLAFFLVVASSANLSTSLFCGAKLRTFIKRAKKYEEIFEC